MSHTPRRRSPPFAWHRGGPPAHLRNMDEVDTPQLPLGTDKNTLRRSVQSRTKLERDGGIDSGQAGDPSMPLPRRATLMKMSGGKWLKNHYVFGRMSLFCYAEGPPRRTLTNVTFHFRKKRSRTPLETWLAHPLLGTKPGRCAANNRSK